MPLILRNDTMYLLMKDRMSFIRLQSLCRVHVEHSDKISASRTCGSLYADRVGYMSANFGACKAQDLIRSMFLFSYLVSSKLFSVHLTGAHLLQAYISYRRVRLVGVRVLIFGKFLTCLGYHCVEWHAVVCYGALPGMVPSCNPWIRQNQAETALPSTFCNI
jgi:hypothetical protein